MKSLNVFLKNDNSAKIGDFGNIIRVKEEDSFMSKSGSEIMASSREGKALTSIGEEAESAGGHETDDEVQRVGTPYYLAPELWKNNKHTKASDIWALGVVLYEMCAHKYPYDANNIEELEEKVSN